MVKNKNVAEEYVPNEFEEHDEFDELEEFIDEIDEEAEIAEEQDRDVASLADDELMVAFLTGSITDAAEIARATEMYSQLDVDGRTKIMAEAREVDKEAEKKRKLEIEKQTELEFEERLDEMRVDWAEWAYTICESLRDDKLANDEYKQVLMSIGKAKPEVPSLTRTGRGKTITSGAQTKRLRNYDAPQQWPVSKAFISERSGICLYGTGGFGAWIDDLTSEVLEGTQLKDYLIMSDIMMSTRENPVKFEKDNRAIVEFTYSKESKSFIVTEVCEDLT